MAHMTNPLATAAQLTDCCARGARRLSPDLLDAVFFATQRLTQAAGLLLELPQSTTAQANVLLARYWVAAPDFVWEEREEGETGGVNNNKTEVADEYCHVSAAALYLVAKIGAHPRSARDVAHVYAYLRNSDNDDDNDKNNDNDNDDKPAFYLTDAAYNAFHTRVLAAEAHLLCALAFDTHVALPHPLAVTYLQALEVVGGAGNPAQRRRGTAVARRALAYLTTALLSPQLLYVTHQPHELAVAAAYLAARDPDVEDGGGEEGGAERVRLPDGPWWEVFDADRETLGFLAVALRSVAAWAAVQCAQTPALVFARHFVPTRARVAAAQARQAVAEESG
ncbi:cyclin domain containing protein [Niveomyces insectorum RCEF 264]|uniref:Cyclin domain containing protein n=1 Tax=Niveomyces insectorum RCEF 264 TaxID=1081102 RepID=A0A167PUN9_9HYPO|nr:cyclin domain containing protein [Niveomyces insectorum RCEF 264]